MDLKLVIATGLFSLAGVLLGGLLVPLTQLFLERKRERRAGDRARLLVAAELLQAQFVLRSTSQGGRWPPIEDLEAFLPTSAWRENRAKMASMVDQDLWFQLVLAYSVLEIDRARFAIANKLPAPTALPVEVAKGMKETSHRLGQLRRQLGLGGGWLDEIVDKLTPEL
jgi:hypothetical protein